MSKRNETHPPAAGGHLAVTINGQERTVPAGTTIGAFLSSRGYRVTMVIVELNGEIVPRERCAELVLQPEDRLEMVHAVGGG